MRKKILGAIIAGLTISLTACGGNNNSKTSGASSNQSQNTASNVVADEEAEILSDTATNFPFGEEFCDGRLYVEKLVEPEKKTTAEAIYSTITYTEQMFYGDYRLNHTADDLPQYYATQQFLDAASFIPAQEISSNLDSSLSISTLPFRMIAGAAEIDNALITDPDHDWCVLYFATKNNNDGVSIEAAYSVEGNTVTFTPLLDWSYDEESMTLAYSLEEDKAFSYEFSFSGPRLTFADEKGSYTLIERDFTNWFGAASDHSISMSSSLSQNSKMVDRITGIDFTVFLDVNDNYNKNKSSFSITNTDSEGNKTTYSGIARWDEDGLFTFSYQDSEGETHSHQLVMFYCGYDGIILSNGTRNYYYLSTFLSEASANQFTPEELEEIAQDLGSNLSEEEKELLETMTEEEIIEIIETRTDLLSDLDTAFSQNGIKAVINEETGEIVLDSSILFATNQYILSDDGKKALNDFITAFASVIGEEKYDGFVSSIEVQGHTDTDGDYDMNLELSTKRAESVRDFCLEEVEGLSDSIISKLESLLVPVGYSYDHPVVDENGNVDKDASRRVEFIFFINLSGK